VIGVLSKELELSEGNSMLQEEEMKELEMGGNCDENQDGKSVRGSGNSGAKAECRGMDIEGIFGGTEIVVVV
jgi:hypothetical protein